MSACNGRYYLDYLDKLVDGYNNDYCLFNGKKPISADYSVLTEKIEINPKALKFKADDRVQITKHKNILSKGYTKSCSREILE